MNPHPVNSVNPVNPVPEDHWVKGDYRRRHPDDTPAWPIVASLISEAIERLFTRIIPAATIGFILVLILWMFFTA